MSSALAIIETMRAQGHPEADILAVVEAAARAAEPVRTKRQERNHRYYEAHKEELQAKASEKRLIKTTEQDAKAAPCPPYEIINSTPPNPPENIQTVREQFSDFRKAYPRRKGANPWTPAENKFIQLVKSGIDPAEIIAGAKTYAASMVGEDPQFVAQAVTWLNQRRWLDEKPTQQTNGAAHTKVFVVRGTEQWAAWLKHLGKQSMPAIDRNGEYGWYFETEWPPDATITSNPPLPKLDEASASSRSASEREGQGRQATEARFAYSR